MSIDPADAMFSTPVYGPQETGARVTHQLLVGQEPSQLSDLQARFGSDDLAQATLTEAEAGDAFAARLGELLASAHIGTHLYVQGDEAFLWSVRAAANDHGLMDEEISLLQAGERRWVYCVHCAHLQAVGPGEETTCEGCGVVLTIRTHFSKRLGAYQGVCLDPTNPRGEDS